MGYSRGKPQKLPILCCRIVDRFTSDPLLSFELARPREAARFPREREMCDQNLVAAGNPPIRRHSVVALWNPLDKEYTSVWLIHTQDSIYPN